MTLRRIGLAAGILLLTAFVYVVLAHGHDGGNAFIVVLAVVLLVAAGNLLYGRHSHGAAAQARIRPAQEARNRAIDEARLREAARPPGSGAAAPVDDAAPDAAAPDAAPE
jgi:hypothetical protein